MVSNLEQTFIDLNINTKDYLKIKLILEYHGIVLKENIQNVLCIAILSDRSIVYCEIMRKDQLLSLGYKEITLTDILAYDT